MPPCVALVGQLHREWYPCGAPIKLLIDILCSEAAVAVKNRDRTNASLNSASVPLDPRSIDPSCYPVHHTMATSSASAVSLQQLVVQFSGNVRLDASRVQRPTESQLLPVAKSDSLPPIAEGPWASYWIFPPATLDLLEEPSVCLETNRRRRFAISCRIPDAVPPTLRGSSVRIEYCFTVTAAYTTPSTTERQSATLRVQVPIASPEACVRPLLTPWVPPCYKAPRLRTVELPPNPVPSFAPPTSDALRTSDGRPQPSTRPEGESGEDIPTTVSSGTALIQKALASTSPTELTLRHGGTGGVSAVLVIGASVVRMGEPVVGALLPESRAEWVCTRVTITLQRDELAPLASLVKGTTVPQQSIRRLRPLGFMDEGTTESNAVCDDYVVMGRHIQDQVTIQATNVVEMPLSLATPQAWESSVGGFQTVSADLVRVEWYLRIVMQVMSAVDVTAGSDADVAHGRSAGLEPQDEYEFPVRVVAPVANEVDCLGTQTF